MKSFVRGILLIIMMLTSTMRVSAVSFALDSIAEWGKFPRFCVNVYRWGDRFFNSYDSTYVKGTGYKFNVKLKADTWSDFYNFNLPNDMNMVMTSDASTTVGVYLTYLAVSAGYDINVNKLLTGVEQTRSRFKFGFNCSLLAVEWSYMKNDFGTTIKRISYNGEHERTNIPFTGINTSEWALETYYFFNHKRYSQAAAFNFSKIQERSQGSIYAGPAIFNNKYDFNFNGLPEGLLHHIPSNWLQNNYRVSTTNYCLRVGYGYNWVFARNWVLGVTESPVIGLRRGKINSAFDSNSFALSNRLGLAVVWNNRKWFAGVSGRFDSNLVYDKDHTFIAALLTAEASVGYRFNIW